MGLLRRCDGVLPTSPEESIDILLYEHFPGSVISEDTEFEDTQSDPNYWADYPWLSAEKIRIAIGQFSPHKTAGLDKLKPVVLQHLPPPLIKRVGLVQSQYGA
ncbi:unnamed protein product [Sphagnum tenellum]